MLLQHFTINPVLDLQEESSSEQKYLPKIQKAKILIIMSLPVSYTVHLKNNTMKHFITPYQLLRKFWSYIETSSFQMTATSIKYF